MFESFFADERRLIGFLSYAMILSGVVAACLLAFLSAPYGRYTWSTWGFRTKMHGRLAWFLQELPSFALPCIFIYMEGVDNIATINKIFLTMFLIHYFQRTFIFPALIQGGKPTPFTTFFMAVFFCLWNGYLQGRSLAHFSSYSSDWMQTYNFRIGVFMFFLGMLINIHSDHILRNLRKPGETGYKIPRGGLFDYVSGANFFGEIVEWAGFALASWSLHGSAFAIFTAFNIGPRAVSHHKWYLKKFSDYPKSRKALIPFLF